MTTTRQAIADALTASGKVEGQPNRPEVIHAGMGWPELREKSPITMHPDTGYEVTWVAIVALTPGSQAATVMESDEIGEAICVALQAAQLRVERFRPGRVQVSSDQAATWIPVLEYTLATA